MAANVGPVQLVLGSTHRIRGTVERLSSDRFVVRCAVEGAERLPRYGDFTMTLEEGEVAGRVRVSSRARSRTGEALLTLTLQGFDPDHEERYRKALHRLLTAPGGTPGERPLPEDEARRVARHHWDVDSRFER
jgi:hypothetical protein